MRLCSGWHWIVAIILISGQGLYSADENSMLMGGLTVIANDGASEVTENPAYLSFPKTLSANSLNVRMSGERTHNLGVSPLMVSNSSQQSAGADLAYARQNFSHKRLSVGAAFSDVRFPLHQKIALEGTVAGSTTVITNNQRDNRFGGAVAAAVRLTDTESIGFRLRYDGGFRGEKENKSSPLNATTTYSSEKLKETSGHAVTAALSYLHRTDRFDFTLLLGNLGMQYNDVSFTFSSAMAAPSLSFLTTTADSSQHIEKFFTDHTQQWGSGQRSSAT